MASKFSSFGLLLVLFVSYSWGATPTAAGCEEKLDIVVLVDGSESISNEDFVRLKQALEDFTFRLRVGDDQTRFGLVLYSSVVSREIDFSGDRNLVVATIRNLTHPKDGTNTDLGIAAMGQMILDNRRSGVAEIGIVITDGRSKDRTRTINEARTVKSLGVDMYSVGVGKDLDKTELTEIASTPAQFIEVNSFSSLSETLVNLLPHVCPPTTTTTTSTPAPTTTTMSTSAKVTTLRTTSGGNTNYTDAQLCEGCDFANGRVFNPHPTDCGKFFHCTEEADGNIKAYKKQCGMGLHWDTKTLTCNLPEKANCLTDPCRIPTTVLYKVEDNCRQYRSCEDRASLPFCCSKGYSFNDQLKRCEPDASCTDLCLGEAADSNQVAECRRTAIPGVQNQYKENVTGYGLMTRKCAAGTGFNQRACLCIDLIEYILPTTEASNECRALVNMTFTNGVMDESGNNHWVANTDVVVINGAAYFNGVDSSLRIPRFTNVPLGTTFRIKMKYRTDGQISGQQALITNRDCSLDESIAIIIDPSTTTFSVKTEDGQDAKVDVSAPDQSQWKVVEYKVADGLLRGEVDGNSDQTTIMGAIRTSDCALQIGRGDTFANFKGYIDYIEVYMC